MTTIWPPDYTAEFARRQKRLLAMRENPSLVVGANEYYVERPADFINDWGITYDPRNAGTGVPTKMPFLLFDRQREFVQFLRELTVAEANGLVEKSRDMGATWLCCGFSVWMWRYQPGSAVGWGSRKEPLVDKLGDPDSIFEKMRIFINALPRVFWPKGFSPDMHMTFMRIVNPETGATITGEVGDNIGRGGRKKIYFKDESAYYERPEKIEASLGDNTNVQVDISTHQGPNTVFDIKRTAGLEWRPGESVVRGRTNVFVFDWREHPAKTQEWYERRRSEAIDNGLEHVFAQEVDRNPRAAVEGVIIPGAWVDTAFDAHIRLGFDDSGMWCAALDVADGGKDKNAFAARKGVVLRALDEWGSRDVGVATRKAVDHCQLLGPVDLEYDCIGVGAGVKSEANRLQEDADTKDLIRGITFVPWNAASAVNNPLGRVVEGDAQSPKNEDFYANLKAQGWWELRLRFLRTFRAVTEGVEYPAEQLISISTKDIPPTLRAKLAKELSQPVMTKNTKLKLLVDKQPEGTPSPNLGDAVMMCYWPAQVGATGFLDLMREQEETQRRSREDAPRAEATKAPVVTGPEGWGA